MRHSTPVRRMAREIMRHANRQGWTGETGDAAAEGAAMGALAAATVMHGERHSLTLDLALFAARVSMAGLAYVEETAKRRDVVEQMRAKMGQSKAYRAERGMTVDDGYFDHDWNS